MKGHGDKILLQPIFAQIYVSGYIMDILVLCDGQFVLGYWETRAIGMPAKQHGGVMNIESNRFHLLKDIVWCVLSKESPYNFRFDSIYMNFFNIVMLKLWKLTTK